LAKKAEVRVDSFTEHRFDGLVEPNQPAGRVPLRAMSKPASERVHEVTAFEKSASTIPPARDSPAWQRDVKLKSGELKAVGRLLK